MRHVSLVAVLGLLLVLLGCASDGGRDVANEPASEPNVEAAAVDEESMLEPKSDLPPVSLATTCQLLFGSDISDGPIADAVELMAELSEADFDHTVVSIKELDEVVDALTTAYQNANEGIAPYIAAVIDPLETMLELKRGGGTADLKMSNFKVSVTEIISQCEPYLY
ncbi:hypothetical protein [Gulosibacter chungangensis]|uniref:Lipoprotein n=1 Tax=Gulosibacter chungangensis TaxID=979746 RepID=A0A7J5B9J3_9MICO|nr:hypothetical protein [Gulosibacter chungangensis]KAB1642235.1 hypothetical protein F8O05_10460 [Gulosibacter chungangensis]